MSEKIPNVDARPSHPSATNGANMISPASRRPNWQTSSVRISPFFLGRAAADACGFDMGCGSGRWARLVAPRVGTLNCIDPAEAALAVAKEEPRRPAKCPLSPCHQRRGAPCPASQDFGYSLGVLHHIPDTASALSDCTRLLKPGAPFLLYLYYRFDNRPYWFQALWRVSDIGRRLISSLPPMAKGFATDVIAVVVYWPWRVWRARPRGLDLASAICRSPPTGTPASRHDAHRQPRSLRHAARTAVHAQGDCRHDGEGGTSRYPFL